MKKIMLVLFLLSVTQQLFAQEHSLVKKWETDSLLKIPESVLSDAKKRIVYIPTFYRNDIVAYQLN